MPVDPRHDLAAFITECATDGSMEADPYSFATKTIATALEYALDDGISGAMSQHEFETLEALAVLLCRLDPAIEIYPRAA